METLQTARLNFRLWTAADFDSFASYFSNEKSAQYLGGKKTREEAWRLMATYIGHYHLKGFSYLALEEKESKKLVGTVGLWKSEPWPEMEMGYWLLDEMQGKGYASEAAMAVKAFAFDRLKAETLVSYIDPNNTPSKKLAQRLGAFEDEVINLLDFGPHCVFRYTS